MHFWMEKTAEKIAEYQRAKEEAKMYPYWYHDQCSHFSFTDYMEDPTEYTKEQFQSHLDSAKELDWIDHMQSSDREQEECFSSSEDNDDESN